MIPIKLTLSGIYSYRDTVQTIDFQKLTSQKLFGIFGAVGSGKSTVIEAIMYALYNKVERIGGKDFKYDLMNLRSNRLWIDFEFLAGDDDKHYRITVESKRNSKKFTEIKPAVRCLYQKISQEWIPIELQKKDNVIEDIIGLKYENFKRVIIIPQGKFQDFLQLGSAERSTMMMEIFKDLQQYDLYTKVSELLDENNGNLEHITGQMSQLEEISKEKVSELTKNLKETEKQRKNREKTIIEVRLQLNQLNELFKLYQKKEKLTLLIDELSLRTNDIQKKEKQLQLYNNYVSLFSSDFAVLKDKQKELKFLTQELPKIRETLEKLNQLKINLNSLFQTVSEKYLHKDDIKNQINQLNRITKIHQLEASLQTLNRDKTSLNQRLKNGETIISQFEKEISSWQTLLLKKKSETLSLKEINQIQKWCTDISVLLEKKNSIQKQINLINEDIENLSEKIRSINSQFSLHTNNTKDIGKILTIIKKKEEKIDDQIHEIQNTIQDLQIQQELNHYSIILKENTPCPLCGSIHHPKPIEISDKTEMILFYKNQISENEKILKNLQETSIFLTQEYQNQTNRQNSFLQQKENLKEINNQLDILYKNFSWKNLNTQDISILEHQIQEEVDKNSQIQKDIDKLDVQKQKLENYHRSKEEIINQIHHLNVKISEIDTFLKSHLNEMNSDILSKYQNYSNDALNSKIQELKNSWTETENQYTELSEKQKNLAEQIHRLEGDCNSKQSHQDKLKFDINTISIHIFSNIKKHQYSITDLNEIENILNWHLNVENMQNEINTYYTNFNLYKNNLQELNMQINGKIYLKDSHNQLQKDLSEYEKEFQNLTALCGSLQSQINNINEKLIIKEILENDKAKLENRNHLLKLLQTLFKGAGFVKYVSMIYLETLCHHANERFRKMTKQQLELILNKEGDFEVRDYLNEGKTRSIKTLSGGQTFQAALAMALALIDHIQSLSNHKQSFFFLDEGFGSQDSESLQIIFETLKSLRQENRIVGIISHVEELQQNIPHFITIVKDNELGSLIKNN